MSYLDFSSKRNKFQGKSVRSTLTEKPTTAESDGCSTDETPKKILKKNTKAEKELAQVEYVTADD